MIFRCFSNCCFCLAVGLLSSIVVNVFALNIEPPLEGKEINYSYIAIATILFDSSVDNLPPLCSKPIAAYLSILRFNLFISKLHLLYNFSIPHLNLLPGALLESGGGSKVFGLHIWEKMETIISEI